MSTLSRLRLDCVTVVSIGLDLDRGGNLRPLVLVWFQGGDLDLDRYCHAPISGTGSSVRNEIFTTSRCPVHE
jgi:hypothetical protein